MSQLRSTHRFPISAGGPVSFLPGSLAEGSSWSSLLSSLSSSPQSRLTNISRVNVQTSLPWPGLSGARWVGNWGKNFSSVFLLSLLRVFGSWRESSQPSHPVWPTSSRLTPRVSSLWSRSASFLSPRESAWTTSTCKWWSWNYQLCLTSLFVHRYTGKLYSPQESTPAKMIVRFPLSESQHWFIPEMTGFVW